MAEDNNDKYESIDKAFETADQNLDDIQKSIDKLDDELLKLNADLIHRKGSKKRALKQQIKNVEQALKRKQRQYKTASRNTRSTTKIGRTPAVNASDITKGLESVTGIVMGVTGAGAMISQGKQISDELGNIIPQTKMLTQDLDEVTVTAPKKDDFISKYKYILIGAGALVLLFLLKKK